MDQLTPNQLHQKEDEFEAIEDLNLNLPSELIHKCGWYVLDHGEKVFPLDP